MNRWLVFFMVNRGQPGYPKRRAVVIDFLDNPASGPFGSEAKIVAAIYEHCIVSAFENVTLSGMVQIGEELPEVILNDEDVTAEIGSFGLDTTL